MSHGEPTTVSWLLPRCFQGDNPCGDFEQEVRLTRHQLQLLCLLSPLAPLAPVQAKGFEQEVAEITESASEDEVADPAQDKLRIRPFAESPKVRSRNT